MSMPSPAPPQAPLPQQPSNGLGTAGFIVGLIGLVFSFIPIIGVIAWPLVIIGLVLSIIGLVRVRQHKATNKGLSIAGISVSGAGLLICIVWAATFGQAADNYQQHLDSLPSSGPATSVHKDDATQQPADDPGEKDASGSIGAPVTVGQLQFTVTKVTSATTVGSGPMAEHAQGKYVVLHLTVKNVGDESKMLTDQAQKLVDGEGRQYSADSMADVLLSENSQNVWLQSINPGNSVTGSMAFDMPSDAKAVKAELRDSMLGTGAVVELG